MDLIVGSQCASSLFFLLRGKTAAAAICCFPTGSSCTAASQACSLRTSVPDLLSGAWQNVSVLIPPPPFGHLIESVIIATKSPYVQDL